MKPTTFIWQVKGRVGTIKLNRPERLNALTFQVYAELRDFLSYLRQDDSVNTVVITGQGRGFCSGGDINEIIGDLVKMGGKELLDFTRMTCDVIKNIRRLKKTVIACVNGAAVGAGAAIALASDLRIGSTNARFGFVFTSRVGLSGADMGVSYFLPRVVGLGRAMELILTGEIIDANEAYRIGLLNRLTSPEKLELETLGLAEKLSNGPQFAIGVTKELLNKELDMGLEAALDAESIAQAVCMTHPDFLEAYKANVEKRSPRFNAPKEA
jgi:enoyl-CoA hydratase/carnithine racemase